MDRETRNASILSVTEDYVRGLLTDSEYMDRCTLVIAEYNISQPARLAYEPCDCIARNSAAWLLPGKVGRLYAVVNGHYHFIRNCQYCGK